MSAPRLSRAATSLRESIFSRLQHRLARHGADGVPLHIGDTWLSPPEIALGVSDVAQWRYGPPAGHPALLEALVARLRRRNLLELDAACLQITVGGTHALATAARAVLDPGDEVIVPTPCWPLIRGIITNAGAVPVEVPFSQRLYADPTLDPAALLAPHVGPRTRALYLTTPNNPDGKVLSAAQLAALGALALERDLWLFSDEAYEDYVYQGAHVSLASLPGLAERTLTAFSFSKSWALAGLRLGVLVGPPAAMAAARKIANHTVYNVPDVLQLAAARLLDDAGAAAWQDEARARYRAARDLAVSLLPAPCHLPDGATYLFADFSRCLRPGEDSLWPLVEELLDAGVSVSPGEQFGRGCERQVRLCFTAVREDRLRVGLERIARVVASRGASK